MLRFVLVLVLSVVINSTLTAQGRESMGSIPQRGNAPRENSIILECQPVRVSPQRGGSGTELRCHRIPSPPMFRGNPASNTPRGSINPAPPITVEQRNAIELAQKHFQQTVDSILRRK